MESQAFNQIRQKIENYCEQHGVTIPLHTEYDDALIGIDTSAPELPVAVYSEEKIIAILTENFEGDHEDALEWYYYNIQGAVIPQNPIIINTLDEYE